MDPFEMMMSMWYKASFAAYSQLMVEKLKKRIEAANGPVMDKVADMSWHQTSSSTLYANRRVLEEQYTSYRNSQRYCSARF